jgi:hypothetical protein
MLEKRRDARRGRLARGDGEVAASSIGASGFLLLPLSGDIQNW